MPKVICAAVDCKYNDDKNCCTAKEICMSDHYIMTVWEGRQHFHRCEQYEMSDDLWRAMDELRRLNE